MVEEDHQTPADDGPRWLGNESEEPVRPPLTRRRVVEAALRLVDDHGLEALSFRSLAVELETSQMAAYNYVRNKDELLDLMLDVVLGEVDLSGGGGEDWVSQLRAMFRSYHRVLLAHPGLVKVYSERVKIGPNGLRAIDRILGVLRDAGFRRAPAANAFYTLYNYTIGFAQIGQVTSVEDGAAAGGSLNGRETIRRFFSALPVEEVPNVVALAPYLTGAKVGHRFEYGLDLLLAALVAKQPVRSDG